MSRSKILLRQNPDFRPQDRRQNPDFRPQDRRQNPDFRRQNPDFRPQDLRKNPPDDTDFWGYVKHYMDYSSKIYLFLNASNVCFSAFYYLLAFFGCYFVCGVESGATYFNTSRLLLGIDYAVLIR